MSRHDRRLAAALGWIDTNPSAAAPVPRIPRDVHGRFVAVGPATMNGGYQPPPATRPSRDDAIAAHNRLIAELIGPRDLGA